MKKVHDKADKWAIEVGCGGVVVVVVVEVAVSEGESQSAKKTQRSEERW